MNIVHKKYLSSELETSPLADYVTDALEHCSYENGQLEDAQQVAAQCAKAIGVLVDHLATQCVIDVGLIKAMIPYNCKEAQEIVK